ncbi:MAG: helix-turn-helix domain-containing protein [Rhizomicrobium sp.]
MTKVTPLNADEKSGRRRIHLREISGDSETPLETVGQDLRAARLRRGDDLATVSRALKIRKDHLEAVEEDRLENLPGRTYAIGFVRTYAGYLGLDVTETVERYKQEISGRHDEHSPTIAAMPDEPRRLPQGWRFVAAIVLLAVGYGVWHLLSAGSTPQAVPPAPTLAPPKVAVAAPPAPVPAAPEQTATPSPAIESSAAASAPPAAPAAAAQSSPPAASTAAAAQPSATPSPAQPEASPSPAAGGTVFGRNNRNARVVLKAKNDTHVMVRGQNGVVYINRDMKAGDSYQLPNATGLTLSTTNAGAVEVDLDGQAMGVAGSDQQSAEDVPLDPQTIADRFSH